MRETLILWAGVLAIVAIAVFGLRSLRRRMPPQPAHPGSRSDSSTAEPSEASTSPASRLDVLSLARQLEPVYEACAHPSDLLTHPEFQSGAAALAEPSVALEQLINYCVGSNEELAAMALEALARRSDAFSPLSVLM